jgi:hypothetical protein
MKRKQSKPTPRKVVNTELSGRLLAVDMLKQMEVYETAPGDVESLWPWSHKAMYRPKGTQQDNVVLRYLETVQGKPKALVGFCSVLTDYTGQVVCQATERVMPFLDFYTTRLTPRDLTGKPGPWPTMEEAQP